MTRVVLRLLEGGHYEIVADGKPTGAHVTDGRDGWTLRLLGSGAAVSVWGRLADLRTWLRGEAGRAWLRSLPAEQGGTMTAQPNDLVGDGFRLGRVIRLQREHGQDGALIWPETLGFGDGWLPHRVPLSGLTVLREVP